MCRPTILRRPSAWQATAMMAGNETTRLPSDHREWEPCTRSSLRRVETPLIYAECLSQGVTMAATVMAASVRAEKKVCAHRSSRPAMRSDASPVF